ncbi:hypothetical protein Vafri_14805 [Volvox africanus]|uniref:Phosphofructokinase domain-containing protein n=1 Tax=Volvox africanus TaxID=51714 RepID=A0A8J4BE70_9CHLO|nr:hypothetical protein Vafri_14805 [Volvox africanus]
MPYCRTTVLHYCRTASAPPQLISEQCRARDLPCCVVGVPKSIENDILLVDRTFGFETAVQEVQRPLLAAKVEASSIRGGIGLVKVMGRHSGFLAMQASLASGVVDVCLIPEVSFTMDGPHGLLSYLGTVLERKGHAVVCVAEGAGQELINAHTPLTKDLLGNPVLHDIGVYLKARFKMHFKDMAEVRYIDPTYMIRTTPCNSLDHIYARVLAHNAVDAAFSGYTGVTVGMCNNHHVLLPIPLVVQAPRRVDPWGMAWNRLRADSGQPSFHPPPSLGRAAISSTASSESEYDTEGTSSPFASVSESSLPSPTLSPAGSVADIATTSAVTAVAAAAADEVMAAAEAAAEGGDGGKGRSPSPTAVPQADETDVMTWMGSEPTGPQDTMSSAAAAGSHGLYGGGEAISPSVEPADVTGEQLHVLATEPIQADLPWPAPPQPGSLSSGPGGGGDSTVFDSCGATESDHSSVDLEADRSGRSSRQAAVSTMAAAEGRKEPGREEAAPAAAAPSTAAAANAPSLPSTIRSSVSPDRVAGRTAEQKGSSNSSHTPPQGGPRGALGAVLRTVTGAAAAAAAAASGGGGGSGGGGANGSRGTRSGAGPVGGGEGGGNGQVRKCEAGDNMQRASDGGPLEGRRAASGVTPPPLPPPPPSSSSKRTPGSQRRPSHRAPYRADDDSE